MDESRMVESMMVVSAITESNTVRVHDGHYIECHMIPGKYLMEKTVKRSQTNAHLT